MRGALLIGVAVVAGIVAFNVAAADDPEPVGAFMENGRYDCEFTPNRGVCKKATTTTEVSSSTSTTTTVSPTTTTQPATTTTSVTSNTTTTTTAPSGTTTTTAPPATTTTTPPSAAAFVDDFSTDTLSAGRYDFGWSGQDPATWPSWAFPVLDFDGDHDMACNGPTTSRHIHLDVGQAGKRGVWWWCAPGGDPAKGHLMTGVNTAGYNIAWFSPKQWFSDVHRVCWDQNLTDLGGGKWTQVVLVSEADVARYNGDLGFTGPGFQDSNGPTTGVHPSSGTGGAKMFRGTFEIWRGGSFTGAMDWWSWDGQHSRIEGFADKAARFTHCMVDNENGTVTLTQERPDGRTVSQTVNGDLPDGRVRVAFQDDNYNPDKHDGTSSAGDPRYSWHWDQIEIS